MICERLSRSCSGHGVEGAHQKAKFVLRLFGNLILEIAGRNFARAFGKGLNGHGNLFGEEQRQPSNGEEQQHGEEQQNEQHLALKGAQVLFLRVVLVGLRLYFLHAREEVRAGAEADNQKAGFRIGGGSGARAAR